MYRATFSLSSEYLEVSGQLHVPAASVVGKETPYPLDKRLSGPHSQSGRCRDKNIFDITGTRTPTPRSSSP
jgi:hypothetical protein